MASSTRCLRELEPAKAGQKLAQKKTETVVAVGGKENHGVEREVREMGAYVCLLG